MWYFGDHAGINFNTTPPTPLSDNGLMSVEGSASIADSSGALLFYTNGEQVFTRNHIVMPNGSGLAGAFSDAQPASIVRKPGSSTLYYVFTCSGVTMFQNALYSIVDMNANGGFGDVIEKNMVFANNVTEGMLVVPHADRGKYWILFSTADSAQMQSYLLDCHGVSTMPVVSHAGVAAAMSLKVTNLCASPDHKKVMLTATYFSTACLMDFDNATGILSDHTFIHVDFPYGCCFSPNSKVLYLDHANLSSGFPPIATNRVLQYDFSSNIPAVINASRLVLDTVISSLNGELGHIALGPDQKMYISRYSASFLPMVTNPDVVGAGCGYVRNGFNISPKLSVIGLPAIAYVSDTMLHPDFLGRDTATCGGTLALNVNGGEAPYLWNTGDTTAGINVAQSGLYYVTTSYCDLDFYDTLKVTIDTPFTFEIAAMQPVCNGPAVLSAPLTGDQYLWNTADTLPSIAAHQNGLYSLTIRKGECVSSDSIDLQIVPTVESLHIPNVFTPNGDNINDAVTLHTNCYTVKKATIYNRWGEPLKNTTEAELIWDGTVNGNYASAGTYYYILDVEDYSGESYSLKGHITVLR